jgi:hypothetical protein
LSKELEAEATAKKLEAIMTILAEKWTYLKAVEDQLAQLVARVESEKAWEKNSVIVFRWLKHVSQELKRLWLALGGETKLWSECVVSLKESSAFLLGDSLLVSAAMTYLGAFSPQFRMRLVDDWKKVLTKVEIAHKQDLTIQ